LQLLAVGDARRCAMYTLGNYLIGREEGMLIDQLTGTCLFVGCAVLRYKVGYVDKCLNM